MNSGHKAIINNSISSINPLNNEIKGSDQVNFTKNNMLNREQRLQSK